MLSKIGEKVCWMKHEDEDLRFEFGPLILGVIGFWFLATPIALPVYFTIGQSHPFFFWSATLSIFLLGIWAVVHDYKGWVSSLAGLMACLGVWGFLVANILHAVFTPDHKTIVCAEFNNGDIVKHRVAGNGIVIDHRAGDGFRTKDQFCWYLVRFSALEVKTDAQWGSDGAVQIGPFSDKYVRDFEIEILDAFKS